MIPASQQQHIDTGAIPDDEKEKHAPWIARKLVGSMTGRIVMSSYETLRATGHSAVCLSPWGDSSPILLPCVEIREVAVHMIVIATGATASIACPILGGVCNILFPTADDDIVVEHKHHEGFDRADEDIGDLLIADVTRQTNPLHDYRLITTAVKSLIIALPYKHIATDAVLGSYRASTHSDPSMFSNVKGYFAIEKGWFSPYLFASGRRPIIRRTLTADLVFCYEPFLHGDYQIGETLLNESASVIILCNSTSPPSESQVEHTSRSHFHLPSLSRVLTSASDKITSASNEIARTTSRLTHLHLHEHTQSPSHPLYDPIYVTLESFTTPSHHPPRRMVVLLLGIKPHRQFWTTSARPGESKIKYLLLNGCPAIVLPIHLGSPLVGWDTLTLEHLHKIGKQPGGAESVKAHGVVSVLFEYLGHCVDWERVVIPGGWAGGEYVKPRTVPCYEKGAHGLEQEAKETVLRNALHLLVAGAINSAASKEARKAVDFDRAGIVMFRIR